MAPKYSPKYSRAFTLIVAFALCFYGFTQSAIAASKELDRLLPLDVVVNGSKSGTWLLLEHDGVLYAPRDAFEDWRIQVLANSAFVDYKNEKYWPLSDIPGYKAKLNVAEQSLELLFSPKVFTATKLQREIIKKPVLSPVLPSVFFNYDFNYARSQLRNAPSIEDLGLLGELGVSNGWGVLTNSFSARNLTRDSTLGVASRAIRLETTFTHDFADENKTLQLGDGVTRAGLLGRNVYFGGIQYGSNFALSPGFVSQPVPVLTGLSATPSTVELYVNDVLRQVSNVPTGPFAINNLPALTGNGDARLVVRDQLGRETVIVQSFFSNSNLLATGLNDWSIEAGSVRQDLGISNGDYGPAFASGTWRHGYNSRLTFEGRLELTRSLNTVQIGAVAGLPLSLLSSAAITSSHDDSAGNGKQWLLGLEHQTLHSSTFVQAQGATQDFRQLGQLSGFIPTKLQLAANWTYGTDHWGSFGLGYASIQRYDSPLVNTYSANYSVRLSNKATLNVIANQVQTDNIRANSLGLNITFLLDKNKFATLNANNNDGANDLYATVTKNPDIDSPLGWRVLAGEQQNHEREEAGFYYLGQHGALTADMSHTPKQTALRLGANGGLVWADGHTFATQRIVDSFALVEVQHYAKIGVGLGSNVQSYTDAKGIAMIPRLNPYQNNQVRLNAADLPINAEIDSIEQTAIPAFRSAVKVKFPVRSGRGALIKILLDDGDVAPAGALVNIEADKQEFYVARRGEAFITGLQTQNRLMLNWKGQQCRFNVTLPAEVIDEYPRIDGLICKGVTR